MTRCSLDEKLARLKKLEAEGLCSDGAVREIRTMLSGSSSALAARAARVAAKLAMRELAPELVAVFNRGLENPVKTDPGCRAKLAAVEALSSLDYPEADVYQRGIRHVQMEPSYGPPVDTADHLRAACAFVLYRLGYSELLYEMVSLLTDREPVARRAAVRVLTEIRQESCEMLLRLKALQGDEKTEILGDCLNGLMAISPVRSLPFVERFLSAQDPAVVEESALAIGNSRLPEAFLLLQDLRERSVIPALKRMLLLPIALTRCEEAFKLLLNAVRTEPPENAAAAIEALLIYSENLERNEMIRQTVLARNDRAVAAAYENAVTRNRAGADR
jgi:hypothetical protein